MSFREVFQEATHDERIQLPEDRARVLHDVANRCSTVRGSFLEFGVYRGGSAMIIAEAVRGIDVRHALHLFDTFDGFAGVTATDGPLAHDGRMRYSDDVVEEVRRAVLHQPLEIHKMSVTSQALDELLGKKKHKWIAFTHVDMDLYEPIKAALQFVFPRTRKFGAIVVDDYGDPDWPGVEKAVNEVVPEKKIEKYGTQAVIWP